MFHGSRRSLPLLSHRTAQKNLVVFLLGFPAAGLLIFLLVNPLGSNYRIISDDYQRLKAEKPLHLLSLHTNEHTSTDGGRTYIIHIWKHGQRLRRRFLKSFGKQERDPYESCSVSNCLLTTEDQQVAEADAVVFHLHQTKGPEELPKQHPPGQLWIFFTDESPYHTFYASRKYTLNDYNGIFNWSMTYRADSDVPVPYGRTVPLTPEEKKAVAALPDYARTKNSTVAILGSNCGGQNGRWEYVRQLQKHINVDIYGGCGTLKCPGHFTRECPAIAKYKFYLAFENSNCREYMTEKLWWNAFHYDVVPVVMGAFRKDYETLCPPRSFIHVDDFESPAELAAYLNSLDRNDTAYNEFFEWKKAYKVVNEHGYFGSPSLHLCRLCERLNAKTSLPKTYYNLPSFWSVGRDCMNSARTPKKRSKDNSFKSRLKT